MAAGEPFDFADAGDLLRRLEPQLDELFREYCVSPAEAEIIVSESLVTLGVGRARIRRPDAWLLDTVRGRCQRLLEERLQDHDGPEN